jgi:ABC-2 type transport system ATP-binding protein
MNSAASTGRLSIYLTRLSVNQADGKQKQTNKIKMEIIELHQVTKTFGPVVAVQNLDLKVPAGTIYGFIGPNGSGKTTTIRMIMNIFLPDNGIIFIRGKKHDETRLGGVGYLPEERGLYKKMKVYDVLKFHAELKNTRNIRSEIDYWLKKLSLYDRADKKVETLSKGMIQKLQFIATVIDKPEIIILDEPFGGLDPVNAEILKESLLELQGNGTTVIFSTHDMNMAERMCDYIFMIHKGKKVLDGTLQIIQDKYGTDTIRLQTEAGMDALTMMNGVERINDYGQMQELRLNSGTDPQSILAEVIKKTRVLKYELSKPSLHDIFIRIAAPERKEANHA